VALEVGLDAAGLDDADVDCPGVNILSSITVKTR
jgi:hypothetical protein